MEIILFCSAILLVLGVAEQRRHLKNICKLPIRVNVNGIRGKSTVTRLITGILAEEGYKVIGKTTGTAARMIYWDRKDEKPIIRKPEGPNIKEQIRIIGEAAKYGADAIVCECMAVRPEYQKIYQEKMIMANIGVIVNVLEDHLDVMGPTLENIAEAFTETIPYNGKLVVSESPYTEYYKRIAGLRGTEVFVADTSRISEEYLSLFDYVIFPENVALALTVAEAMGIDQATAMKGMLDAHPDPGVLRIFDIGRSKKIYFVNGFAANDPSSTLNIWKRVGELGYPIEDAVLIMNCRADRVDRTEQFARDVFTKISAKSIILIGAMSGPVVEAFNKGMLPVQEVLRFENYSSEKIYEFILENYPGKTVYGVGNIHGSAEGLVEIFEGVGRSNKKRDEYYDEWS